MWGKNGLNSGDNCYVLLGAVIHPLVICVLCGWEDAVSYGGDMILVKWWCEIQ